MPFDRRRVNAGRRSNISISGDALAGGVEGGYNTSEIPVDESTLEQGSDKVVAPQYQTTFTSAKAKHPVLDALFNHGSAQSQADAINQKYGEFQMGNQADIDKVKLVDELAKSRIALEEANKQKAITDNTNRVLDAGAKTFTRAQGHNEDDPLALSLNRKAMEDDAFQLGEGNIKSGGYLRAHADGEGAKADEEGNINRSISAKASRDLIPSLTKASQRSVIAKSDLDTDESSRKLGYNNNHPDDFDESYGSELKSRGINNDLAKSNIKHLDANTAHVKAVQDALTNKDGKWSAFGGDGSLFNPDTNLILTYDMDDTGKRTPIFLDAITGARVKPINKGGTKPANETKVTPKKQTVNREPEDVPDYTKMNIQVGESLLPKKTGSEYNPDIKAAYSSAKKRKFTE